MSRLDITKTYKLYINGKFPRSESGRSTVIEDTRGRTIAHVCHASRKDLRDAVVAARKAQGGWSGKTAYNRGQILYRLAEMLEGKREEFVASIRATTGESAKSAREEVDASVDRLVAYAGWADKYPHVIGCHNPVAGPYYNFSVPQATGVVGVMCPDELPLLALVSLIAPVICAGNTVVALGSESHPVATSIFAEVCATSDVPGGVINLLTGYREELAVHMADHRDIDAIHAANIEPHLATTLREGAAENVKRVRVRDLAEPEWFDESVCESPWWIESMIEIKTIWHTAAT
ncbi:MAG: aldehyde dehydrogenase family protein [Planctomycetota bacterium]|jgi:acyl-CoA reductase-like NAD-dependent aldehyde dehydrogenase